MERSSEERPWGLNEPATALEVAGKLMKREIIDDLRYRGVQIDAHVVDVTPCHEPLGSSILRYFVLRPVAWPMEPELLPAGPRMPSEWRSEVLVLPRQDGGGLMTRLAPFEAEFAVRSFLRRVEREIDSVLKRAQRHRTSRTQH